MKYTSIYLSSFLIGMAIGYMEEEMIHNVITKSNRASKKIRRDASRVLDDVRDMMD